MGNPLAKMASIDFTGASTLPELSPEAAYLVGTSRESRARACHDPVKYLGGSICRKAFANSGDTTACFQIEYW